MKIPYIIALVLLASPALSQEAPTVQSTAEDANRIIGALQTQRNSALDQAAGAQSQLAKANDELAKAKAQIADFKAKEAVKETPEVKSTAPVAGGAPGVRTEPAK
jgi:chromosome segregation ATPase